MTTENDFIIIESLIKSHNPVGLEISNMLTSWAKEPILTNN